VIAALMLAPTLTLAHNRSGVTLQHRKDTLVVDGKTYIGNAIPTEVKHVAGDINHDGNVSTSDIVALVRMVLFAQPAPTGDTLLFYVPKDGKTYIFLNTRGANR